MAVLLISKGETTPCPGSYGAAAGARGDRGWVGEALLVSDDGCGRGERVDREERRDVRVVKVSGAIAWFERGSRAGAREREGEVVQIRCVVVDADKGRNDHLKFDECAI